MGNLTPIPYINLALQHREIRGELLEAIAGIIDDGQFILGPQVEEFERALALACQTKFAIGLNSGTDALILALRALNIGPGDEVITVPNSFVASTSAIRLVGAQPIFVDVGDDYNIDPTLIDQAITSRTKAIMPVHLTGRPCRMDQIMKTAERHGLHVVEDCAQAILATYQGKSVGSFGAFGAFSLHPLKTLNACGDAGAITTNDAAAVDRLRILRNIGLRTREDCVEWSGNSRLDTLQAAVLLVKLKHLQRWTEARRNNAARYCSLLQGVDGIRLPSDRAEEYAVYHTLVVQVERREALREFLTERGIGTAIHYPFCIHLSAAGRDLNYPAGSFPVAERQAGKILSLPVHQNLTENEIDRITSAIREFYQG